MEKVELTHLAAEGLANPLPDLIKLIGWIGPNDITESGGELMLRGGTCRPMAGGGFAVQVTFMRAPEGAGLVSFLRPDAKANEASTVQVLDIYAKTRVASWAAIFPRHQFRIVSAEE